MAWNDGKVELFGVDWYLAKNVCDTIGVQNTTLAVKSITETCKQKVTLTKEAKAVWLINTRGVIELLQKSRKQIAKDILAQEFAEEAKMIESVKPMVQSQLRGVYRLLRELKDILEGGSDSVGLNILLAMQLNLLELADKYPTRASQAYYKWVHILIKSENINNVEVSTRKYMRCKKQPKRVSLVWIKKYVTLTYIKNTEIMSADDMLYDLLETQLQEVLDLRFGYKKLYWYGNEPYMLFSRVKLLKWVERLKKTKPFKEGARNRFISPKNVVQEIIESIHWCKNKMSGEYV